MIACEPSISPSTGNQSRSIATLAALTLATFCFVTSDNFVIGLLPQLADGLRVSLSKAGRLASGYGITVAVSAVPLAILTRRIPRRYLLGGALSIFVATTLVAAAAESYLVLLMARAGTALTQAIFWAVVAPTAAGLFSPAVRGKAVATIFCGASFASIAGVPAGTWLGQHAGWRIAFVALGGVGALSLVAIVTLLPTEPVSLGKARIGSEPHAARYAVLTVVTVLTAAGAFCVYTYVTPFLMTVSGFPSTAVSPILTITGAAGIAGNVAIGLIFDRNPRAGLILPLIVLTALLLGLYVVDDAKYPAVALIGLWSMSMAALGAAFQARVLQVAPSGTELAAAGNTAAFSLGNSGGAWIGGAVLSEHGARATAPAGAILTAVALGLLFLEPLLATPGRRRPPHEDQVAQPGGNGGGSVNTG